jgi:hypothetical protein
MTDETKTVPEVEHPMPGAPTDTARGSGNPSVEHQESVATPPSPWWRIADFGVFGLWVAIVAYILPYHEKWADEAQAWLIARDLDLKTIWFHELRYEGSPGLWHTILWIAQHVFHAKYDSIGKIGAVCAAAGVALLIFAAPFPRYIRWPLAFTYFMIYQYAVIARPYTLLPLLAFATAMLFKDLRHPERITIVLVLLANLSLHGTILAGCLGLVYLIDAYKAWKMFDASVKRRYWICIWVMAATFVFIGLIMRPTPDVAEFAPTEAADQPIFKPTPLQKLEAGFCGGFVDSLIPSVLVVLYGGVWCFFRKRLLAYALPVGLLFLLYAVIHGYAHHHGTMFVAAIAGLWIAWPTGDEQKGFNARERWATYGMTAVLLVLCGVNIWDSVVVLKREYKYPYCGAKDAADYLRSVGADRDTVFGYLFGTVAVQAYFDRNIFANMPTAYFHQGVPFKGTKLNLDELFNKNPEYLVAYSNAPDLMLDTDGPVWTSLGYELVHFSDGYYMFKGLVYQREAYFIFHRTRELRLSESSQAPPKNSVN